MNKFIKFTIGAIVALLIVEAISFAQALDARAAEPDALALVARTKGLPPETLPLSKGLPPLLARQEYTTDATDAGPKTTSLPISLPSATPSDVVNTLGKGTTTTTLSGSASPYYTPSGTGSLIPSWSAWVAKGGVPSGQPTVPPTPPTTTKPAETGSAHKIESGLFSAAIIAGIVGFFF